MAAIYRITIKGWDKHYGEGHTLFSRIGEYRRSKSNDANTLAELERQLKINPPSGRQALAWAEVSENRYGTTRLAVYQGVGNAWALK